MLKPRRKTYGSLDCIVVDGGDAPSILAVLCHGYGAPGTDLASLSMEWCSLLGEDAERFRFVFPAAPHSLEELGMDEARAWWPINMAQLALLVQTSQFSELHNETPPGIDEARDVLCDAIKQMRAEIGEASKPVDAKWVLGGFSQGAMLSLDTALRGDIDPPSLLVLFSGTLVCQSKWAEKWNRLKETTIYQAHGRRDPLLPYSSAKDLSNLLKSAGLTTEFFGFDGPHTIDSESLVRTAELMRELAR